MTDLQTVVTDTPTVEFRNDYCAVVRNFLDETTVQTLSLYMENKLHSKNWMDRPAEYDIKKQPSQYSSYADPLAEVVLLRSAPQIENLVGFSVFPTYSYSRIYVKGDELVPHTDRPSCEISATVNLGNVGGFWPIWMQAPNHEPMQVELHPGDAVVYRGCEVLHWREKMVKEDVTVQFMLHYVKQDGPNAKYKWDKRPGLGYPHTSRGT